VRWRDRFLRAIESAIAITNYMELISDNFDAKV
jgi:hypothetical protein